MLSNLSGNADRATTSTTDLTTSLSPQVILGKSALDLTVQLNRSTSEPLQQALQGAETALSQFAADPNFAAKMNVAFGDRWNLQAAKSLFQAWSAHDFRNLPKLEIRLSSEINNANGAFASATNTIYISRDFLAQNASNPKAVTSVLLEEIGHAIDFRINKTDAAGDEGDIFSRLVRGEKMSANELMLLKIEDDSATIRLDGKSIKIEQSSTLEAAKDKDGRLEEFTISAEGKVMQRYQFSVNSGWSGWNDLGLVAGGKELEVVQNQDGRLELFVIGKDNEVYQAYQKVPNGISGWSGWNKFGLQASEVEVSVDQDGRLEAFAIRTDGSLMQKYQVSVNSSWTSWIDFGRKASEIDMVQNKDGRLELFAIEKGTNEVFQRYQLKANGIGGWSGWNQFGLQAKDIEVVQNKDGRLEAFAIRTDGEVFEKYQMAVNSSWSGWNQFGVKASEIEVAQNADGRLELFAIRDNGDLLHKWQTAVNSSWSNWTSTNLQAIEVESIRNTDGRLEIFAIDTKGQAQSQWQLKANGTTGWSSWNQQSGIKALGEDQLNSLGDRLTQLANKSGVLSSDEIREYRQLVAQKPEAEQTNWYRQLQPKIQFFNQRNNASKYNDKYGQALPDNMCGVTSLASALTYLGASNPKPGMQFEDALEVVRREQNYTAKSGGAEEWAALGQLAKYFGATSLYRDFGQGNLGASYIKEIKAAIDRGAAVVLGTNVPGTEGHIVRIQGYDATGFIIDDPFGDVSSGTYSLNSRNDDGEGQAGNNNKWSYNFTTSYSKRFLILDQGSILQK